MTNLTQSATQKPVSGSETTLLDLPKPSFCSKMTFLGDFLTFWLFEKPFSLSDKHSSLSDKRSSFNEKHSSLNEKVFSLSDKPFSSPDKQSSLPEECLSVFKFGVSFSHQLAGKLPGSLSFGRFRGKHQQPTACAASGMVRP